MCFLVCLSVSIYFFPSFSYGFSACTLLLGWLCVSIILFSSFVVVFVYTVFLGFPSVSKLLLFPCLSQCFYVFFPLFFLVFLGTVHLSLFVLVFPCAFFFFLFIVSFLVCF